MIAGIFHKGSGLGNQLHRYVATRVLALDKGYKWTMVNPENFKGTSFMPLEIPKNEISYYHDSTFDTDYPSIFTENKTMDNEVDIRGYDPEFNFIEDNTVIDGEFQDERYWAYRENDVAEWLKVDPIEIPDDVCVIGFRGGEFAVFPDLYLTADYWIDAVNKMLEINPAMKFEVHTDDIGLARQVFPGKIVISNIELNWRSMRYAKYAIIANSSFYILPRWLRNGVTIAPRYWARRNTKTWSMPQNYYSRFKYI